MVIIGRILKVKTLCDLLCLQRLHPDSHSPFQSELNIVVVNFMFVVMTDELWTFQGIFGGVAICHSGQQSHQASPEKIE